MANSTRTTRVPGVIGALVIAGVLVGGAYVISTPGWKPFKANVANAASTQELLQSYAKKDSDGDGLPDWEEALYGTDPSNAHSVSAGLTDSEAVDQGLIKPKFSSTTTDTSSATTQTDVPGSIAGDNTVTAQFSQALFSKYLQQSNGTPPTQDQVAQYVQSAIQDLVNTHQTQNAYSVGNISVSGSGPDALTTYAGKVENAFASNAASTAQSELDYFADAVEQNDTSALTSVAAIGKAYTATAQAFVKIPAPTEAATAHLAVANALARLGSDITDMSTLSNDPLRAYLGLEEYQADSQSLVDSLTAMHAVFIKDNVDIETGAGSSFYKATVSATQPH